MAGVILLVLNLPLVLFGITTIPWWIVVLLLVAPSAAAFLQLALSRTREFHADALAARLTGDPAGFAAALRKLHSPPAG